MHLVYLLNKRLYGSNNYRLGKLYSSIVTNSFYTEDVQLYYGVNFLRYLSSTQSPSKKKEVMESTMSKMDQKSAVYMIFSAELEAMSFDDPSYKKLSEREKRVKLRALQD